MKPPKLTLAQEATLREQVIDADHPGSVLHDFQIVLKFVGDQGVPATGKYNLFPLAAIPELDERLSRPLRLQLKRPQLRSHPYLQGLHLLLRTSGLSRLQGVGTKARLVLDPAVRDRWEALNPTEQYFTLLEAWLRFGRAEIVGEWDSPFKSLRRTCVETWNNFRLRGAASTWMSRTIPVAEARRRITRLAGCEGRRTSPGNRRSGRRGPRRPHSPAASPGDQVGMPFSSSACAQRG